MKRINYASNQTIPLSLDRVQRADDNVAWKRYISGSHGGEYEDDSLLGYSAM
jgi:hypothetical protein